VGIGLAFLITFCATFSEAFSKKGWDNLTIPATVIIVLFLAHKVADSFQAIVL